MNHILRFDQVKIAVVNAHIELARLVRQPLELKRLAAGAKAQPKIKSSSTQPTKAPFPAEGTCSARWTSGRFRYANGTRKAGARCCNFIKD